MKTNFLNWRPNVISTVISFTEYFYCFKAVFIMTGNFASAKFIGGNFTAGHFATWKISTTFRRVQFFRADNPPT